MSVDAVAWKPVSELKVCGAECVEVKGSRDKRDVVQGDWNLGNEHFTEPLEVKTIEGAVFYREMSDGFTPQVPEIFDTQYGFYDNHEHGEFSSLLSQQSRGNTDDLDDQKSVDNASPLFSEVGDVFMGGYFCDMFDCGDFIFAVSNVMHSGQGLFKVVRFNKNYRVTTMYDNSISSEYSSYRYIGRYENNLGYMLVVTGVVGSDHEEVEDSDWAPTERSILFQLYTDGSIDIDREWNISISPATSIATLGDDVFFGQNKMITKLNVLTGEVRYLVHENAVEMAGMT